MGKLLMNFVLVLVSPSSVGFDLKNSWRFTFLNKKVMQINIYLPGGSIVTHIPKVKQQTKSIQTIQPSESSTGKQLQLYRLIRFSHRLHSVVWGSREKYKHMLCFILAQRLIYIGVNSQKVYTEARNLKICGSKINVISFCFGIYAPKTWKIKNG